MGPKYKMLKTPERNKVTRLLIELVEMTGLKNCNSSLLNYL